MDLWLPSHKGFAMEDARISGFTADMGIINHGINGINGIND